MVCHTKIISVTLFLSPGLDWYSHTWRKEEKLVFLSVFNDNFRLREALTVTVTSFKFIE